MQVIPSKKFVKVCVFLPCVFLLSFFVLCRRTIDRYWLIDWLVDWLIGWLIDWLIDCSFVQSVRFASFLTLFFLTFSVYFTEFLPVFSYNFPPLLPYRVSPYFISSPYISCPLIIFRCLSSPYLSLSVPLPSSIQFSFSHVSSCFLLCVPLS